MTKKHRSEKVALSANQRSIYGYLLHHKKKYSSAPCFVPKVPNQSSRLPEYLRALEVLEEKGLITVARDSPTYTAWIIDLPKQLRHSWLESEPALDRPAQMD